MFGLVVILIFLVRLVVIHKHNNVFASFNCQTIKFQSVNWTFSQPMTSLFTFTLLTNSSHLSGEPYVNNRFILLYLQFLVAHDYLVSITGFYKQHCVHHISGDADNAEVVQDEHEDVREVDGSEVR